MKKNTTSRKKLLITALSALVMTACKFPYQPEPFVMPETPADRYLFPSQAEMTEFTGSSKTKIVFTLKENGVRVIYYYDYTDPAPSLKKLKQPDGKETFNSDSPLLSPDGSFVTYFVTPGAVIEGAYIQKLDPDAQPVLIAAGGTEPHWWQDSSGQVYVIYSDNLVSNLNVDVGYTLKQKVSLTGNGSLVEHPDTIAPFPMKGGLSKDGVYLCTGDPNAGYYNTATNQMIRINGISQVCNPSINPDTAGDYLMMFLNFEGAQNMTNPYQDSADYPADTAGIIKQHVVLFITDITNTVRDFVPISLMGGPYKEWQDPEWSNKPRFGTALAVINGSEARGVIIKNIGDHALAKKTLIFTKGKGVLNITSTPSVWIGD